MLVQARNRGRRDYSREATYREALWGQNGFLRPLRGDPQPEL